MKRPLYLHAEAAVLRHAALGDIQIAEHFDARENGGVPFLRDRLHGVLQHAVDAVLHGDFGVAGFDVDVRSAALERGEDDGFDQADDGADGGVAGEAITGDRFVAFLFVLGNLQGEGFGGLLEHALGLLGALEQVADLARRGDLDRPASCPSSSGSSSLSRTWLGSATAMDKQVVLHFERNEVVAEHQIRGNRAEQFGIDALFAQIDEAAAIAFGQLAGVLALVLLVGSRGQPGQCVGDC